ncbi:4468_t:CDS:2, partial [Acaulospora morrowiae]
ASLLTRKLSLVEGSVSCISSFLSFSDNESIATGNSDMSLVLTSKSFSLRIVDDRCARRQALLLLQVLKFYLHITNMVQVPELHHHWQEFM